MRHQGLHAPNNSAIYKRTFKRKTEPERIFFISQQRVLVSVSWFSDS